MTAFLLFRIALFFGTYVSAGAGSVVLTTLLSILFLPLCAFVITMD